MNKQSEIQSPKSKIAIVGGGPGGASLAIRLAGSGFDVSLIERERFPRHKLCGEFISPECLRHFQDLGVLDEMLAAGGERVTETRFYALNGKSVSVSSEWFGNAAGALGLSRAEMDYRLLEKAKNLGVEVLEETQAVGILFENERVCGLKARNKSGEVFEIPAALTIDATGRSSVLAKLSEKELSRKTAGAPRRIKDQRSKLIGFKAHLENVDLKKGRCEIYSFRGGYGGLSYVENNLANHCFLVKAELVKKYIGQTNLLIEEVIFENRRARETMRNASPVAEWLAVSVDGFGVKKTPAAKNLFAVGDAAAFIDPFTGSGMLMALESAQLLAGAITRDDTDPEKIADNYRLLYARKFQRRLRVCSLLRRVALMPELAKIVISALGLSRTAQECLARATRQSSLGEKSDL